MVTAQGLTLRPDHGSQFMSHDSRSEIAFLGPKPAGNNLRRYPWLPDLTFICVQQTVDLHKAL